MRPTDAELAYYAEPGELTALDAHAALIADAPDDIAGLAKFVQNLIVHRAWAGAYKFELDNERLREETIRAASAMLTAIVKLSDAPLSKVRTPDKRMVGDCRHFATMTAALLRHRGVPARARCGFGTYFQPGKHVDHWVCEYWDGVDERWVLVDAQLDGLQQAALKLDFDPLDVPRERFWVAGQAWQRVREGSADGDTFGIADMWGPWFIKGDLWLDVASLNKTELLPWDVASIKVATDDETLDGFAAATVAGDGAAVRALYGETPSMQVPDSLMEQVRREDAAGGAGQNPVVAG